MTRHLPGKSASTAVPVHPLLAERWSPRGFDQGHELGDAALTALLEAARWAPSAQNSQPWRFLVTRRGFVTRQDCPGDRRGAVVVLTGPGRAAIESAAPGHVTAVRRLVFDQMDSAQARAFGQAFEAILAALEEDGR